MPITLAKGKEGGLCRSKGFFQCICYTSTWDIGYLCWLL